MINVTPGTIVGLTGYLGSGKTELAKQAASRHQVIRLAFADPIKNVVSALLQEMDVNSAEMRYRMLRGDLKEEPVPGYDVTPRRLMQTLGVEWGRNIIDPYLWVNLTMTRAKALLDRGCGVIIDDVRFETEANAIRALGGRIILVNNPKVVRVSDHVSENIVDHDEIVMNEWPPS